MFPNQTLNNDYEHDGMADLKCKIFNFVSPTIKYNFYTRMRDKYCQLYYEPTQQLCNPAKIITIRTNFVIYPFVILNFQFERSLLG